MKVHPIAEAFPLLDGPHLEQLAESIKAVGQKQPIIVLDNAILDGRCRAAACKLAKVDPKTTPYKGKKDTASLIAYVDAVNDKRRHLTGGQRAAAAFKLTRLSLELKNGNPANLPVSQSAAAEKLGVSERSVRSAGKVIQEGAAAVVKAVEAGEVAVSDAAAIADLPKTEQVAALNKVKSGESKTLRQAAENIESEDCVGQPLPDKLREVFLSAEEFEKQYRILGALKKWAEEIVATVPGSYLHAQSFIGSLSAAQKQLKFEKPYAVCPYCQALKKKCEACKGRGFVTKPIYDGAPSELRV